MSVQLSRASKYFGRGFWCALACAWWMAIASTSLAIPTDELLKSLRPAADVNDYAGVLSKAERDALEARCKRLREKTGAQLAVVTIKSLEGGQIDDFANKLFARWGIGHKDKKDGLLLIVAMDDRKSRIEVGYGLEPIIPDILAGRILDHQLKPQFRQGNYAAGLTAAVNALCELVEKGEPADRNALAAKEPQSPGDKFVLAMFLALFVGVGALMAGIGAGTKTVAAIFIGMLFWGVGVLGGLVGAWPIAPWIHIPVTLAGAWLGWYSAKHSGTTGGKSRSLGGPSTWQWGGGSSSSGGWSSGGGGFSSDWGGFSGGSSGGGGASSDW